MAPRAGSAPVRHPQPAGVARLPPVLLPPVLLPPVPPVPPPLEAPALALVLPLVDAPVADALLPVAPPLPLVASHVPFTQTPGEGQSAPSRQATHVYAPFVPAQKGVMPPQGEQVGPQKMAVSQGAHSAASLQIVTRVQPLLPAWSTNCRSHCWHWSRSGNERLAAHRLEELRPRGRG